MKFVNDIIKEYAVDKMLHFLVGALTVAMASITGIVFFGFTGFLVATFIMIPVVYVLSYVKEKKLDDKYDFLDIKAGYARCRNCGYNQRTVVWIKRNN